MIKNILKKIFKKAKRITTDKQRDDIDSESYQKAKEILKEEEEKLKKIKNKLNRNLNNLFNENIFL